MRQGRVDGDRQRRGAALHFATASPPTEGRWSWEGSEAAEHAAALGWLIQQHWAAGKVPRLLMNQRALRQPGHPTFHAAMVGGPEDRGGHRQHAKAGRDAAAGATKAAAESAGPGNPCVPLLLGRRRLLQWTRSWHPWRRWRWAATPHSARPGLKCQFGSLPCKSQRLGCQGHAAGCWPTSPAKGKN